MLMLVMYMYIVLDIQCFSSVEDEVERERRERRERREKNLTEEEVC